MVLAIKSAELQCRSVSHTVIDAIFNMNVIPRGSTNYIAAGSI